MMTFKKYIAPLLLIACMMATLSSCSKEAVMVTGNPPITPTTPQEAIDRLTSQNTTYVTASANTGDISVDLREDTVENGQSPYAVVLTCSDSRVVPEHIFMEGIGSLFTIRNAGNIVDDTVLGSIEYGGEHLGAKVIVVLGHSNCGAVSATIGGGNSGYIATITDTIAQAIDGETDASSAEVLNVQNSMDTIMTSPVIAELVAHEELAVVGAIYDTTTGKVTFLDYEATAPAVDLDALYQQAVDDSMVAEENEILPLVTLTTDDPMTTWNDDGEVLLVTWNSYPDSYVAGSTVNLSYGSVWTFTEGEMLAWYEENRDDIDDVQLRFNQLLGLPPEDDNTHFTAVWADPEYVLRPAFCDDITTDTMTADYPADMIDSYRSWFDGNTQSSYYGDTQYPWTRLGYTYDWADNGTEYGLSEFLAIMASTVEVEYTMTTAEFLAYMDGLLDG